MAGAQVGLGKMGLTWNSAGDAGMSTHSLLDTTVRNLDYTV